MTVSPLEVSVWSSPTNMLDILDGAASVQWLDMFGDVGAGSCEISKSDPKATTMNMRQGNIVQCSIGGTPVFGYLVESPVDSAGEGTDNKYILAGPAVLSYLRLATVYPLGGVAAPVGTTRKWIGKTFGDVLGALIVESQALGTIPNLTKDFTATLDSNGVAWTTTWTRTVNVGATLLDVVMLFVSMGMGVSMSPSLCLSAYNPGTQGRDLTNQVIWRQALHLAGPVTNTGSLANMTTVCLVQGANGAFVEVTDPAYTSDPTVGRRESFLDYSQVSGDVAEMTAAGLQQIALTETESRALTVRLTHGIEAGQYEPYDDYQPGDTIALDVPGTYSLAPELIAALTIKQTPAGGFDIDAALGSVSLPLDLRNRRQIESVAGTTRSLTGGGAGRLTLASPKVLVTTPAVQNLVSATQIVIPPDYQGLIPITSTTGNKTLTATPTLSNGTFEGQKIKLQNQDPTYKQTLQDRGTLASSQLNLVAATQTLAVGGGSIELTWTFTIGAGRWVQTAALVSPL